MQDANAPNPIMDILRESTKELHDSAEGNHFQKLLGSGKVPIPQYKVYLEQLYLMHRRLSELLAQKKTGNEAISKVVNDHHLDLTAVSNDLAYFDKNIKDAEPLEATKELTSAMEQTANEDPTALLGYLYVLEGSTNGAKFMAKNLRAGLSLPEEAGASYFDRYGAKQRELWMAFKADMATVPFSRDETDAIVARAKEIFASFGKIGNEIMQTTPV